MSLKKLLLVLLFLLIACTEGGGDEEGTDSPSSSATPIVINPPIFNPGSNNPACTGIQPFSDGTLWKPVSDTNGNVVFIASAKFVTRFLSCSIRTRAGQTEDLTFFYFANGNRQHWRGQRPGGHYEDNGKVVCVDSGQVCVFQFSGSSSSRHE